MHLLRVLGPRIGVACRNYSRISTNSSSITVSISFSISIIICISNNSIKSSGCGGCGSIAVVGAGTEDVPHDPTAEGIYPFKYNILAVTDQGCVLSEHTLYMSHYTEKLNI